MPASGNEIKQERVLKLSPKDNVLVALADLRKDETIAFNGSTYTLATDVPREAQVCNGAAQPGDDVIDVWRARREGDQAESRRRSS